MTNNSATKPTLFRLFLEDTPSLSVVRVFGTGGGLK
jgi:hypothetical protein